MFSEPSASRHHVEGLEWQMSVRTIVGFVADFPVESSEDDPPGYELADFVVQRLRETGFAASELDDREGWAWDFRTTKDQLDIVSVVGLVDDMDTMPPRQWLITNDCELGFLQRIFGAKDLAEKRERFLRGFCLSLHQIISADSRFSHIMWYDKDTFDKPEDDPGATP